MIPMAVECFAELPFDMQREWADFLARSAHQHPRQGLDFAPVEKADGRDCLHGIGRCDGKVVAIGLFTLIRHPFLRGAYAEAQCLSGPVCDSPQNLVSFLDNILRHPSFSRVGRLKVTPYWVRDEAKVLHDALEAGGWAVSEPEVFRKTGWVDLRPDPEAILQTFSKSARREVRRAERQGVRVETLETLDAAKEFLDSLNRLRHERGLGPVAQAGFLQSFSRIHVNADQGVILVVRHSGTFIAGLQLYRSRDVAHGRHFTTEPETLRHLGNLRIAPFLWLEGMKWAKSKGCVQLDVEGYDADLDPNLRTYNINKYKAEFAPMPVVRISERKRLVNPVVNLTGNGKSMLKAAIKSALVHLPLRGRTPR
jgi:hypothetical protein